MHGRAESGVHQMRANVAALHWVQSGCSVDWLVYSHANTSEGQTPTLAVLIVMKPSVGAYWC